MIPIRELQRRAKKIRKLMSEKNLEALLVTRSKNLFYLTGKRTGELIITLEGSNLRVKKLYVEIHHLYHEEGYPWEVRVKKGKLEERLKKLKVEKIGVEDSMKLKNFRRMKGKLKSQVELIPTNVMEKARAIKTSYEISCLRKSAEIARRGMEKAYEVIQPGIKEKDAQREIEYEIRKLGSETPPFERGLLLSSGKNSANIHALSTYKKISKNSLVVVDLGANFKGYHSDMSRTIKLGNLNKKHEKVFEFVKDLESRTIQKIKEGMKARKLHEFVKKEIKRLGYDFYHNTGHGIGLEVHELPNLSPQSEDDIKEGMVFTIEPGIYLPEKFGVRFEDTILCKREKVEILTK